MSYNPCEVKIPYAGFIVRDKIFLNFADLLLCVKILFANITINQSYRLTNMQSAKNFIRKIRCFPTK